MEKSKNPILAAILNFILPGAGFIYIRKPSFILLAGVTILFGTIFNTVVYLVQGSVESTIIETADEISKSANTFSSMATSVTSFSNQVTDQDDKAMLVQCSEALNGASGSLQGASKTIKSCTGNNMSLWGSLMISLGLAFLTYFWVKEGVQGSSTIVSSTKEEKETPENKVFCKVCGAKNAGDVKFCAACGKPLT